MPRVYTRPWLDAIQFSPRPSQLSTTVQKEFPFTAKAVVPDKMTRDEVERIMAGMAKVDHEMREEMAGAVATAAKVKAGVFRDADSFHKGSGQAIVYRLPDGSHVLRLENFHVTNGPALHVLLTPHPDPATRGDLSAQGYANLGQLKGNIGNQNYPVPPDLDLAAQRSVVIYCLPFHVVFSVAPLQDVR